jgi:hypothetical protein
MTLIPELRAELAAMTARKVRRRRRWFFGLTPVALVVTTTAALAAGGVISIGSPAEDPPALGVAKPDADTGVVVKGTDRLLSPRAADPDGGPPWGLRLYSTTRRLGCLMPGRVVSGKIGVYGRYGAFDDDGRLHPFAPDTVGNSFSNCAPLDAGGRLFFSVNDGTLVASASRTERCSPRIGTQGGSGLCAAGTERTVLYGTLGPQAKSVTYTSPTGPKTIPTSGPEGAYLIVLPSGKDISGTGPSRYPQAEAITQIAFHNGRTCTRATLESPDVGTACPLPGFRPLAVKLPTREEIGAPVTATARLGRRFWVLRVKFRARVAVEDATAAYNVRIARTKTERGRSTTGVTHRNIHAGELVEQVFQHVNGGGEYRILVTYNRTAEPGQLPMGTGNGVTVGRFRLRIP